MFKTVHLGDDANPFEAALAVVPLRALYIHEEIVQEFLDKLIISLTESNVFKHPIIVDKNSNVILDGMHRYQALRLLGYNYIVACLVDYNHSAIKIGRWHRVIEGKLRERELIKIINFLEKKQVSEISLEKVSIEMLEQDLRKHKAAFGLYIGRENEVLGAYSDKNDVFLFYKLIKDLEIFLNRELGVAISYRSDEILKEIKQAVKQRETCVIITPQVTKDDVVCNAVRRRIFPPKTTRHIMPIRPLFVNFPMDLLRGSQNVEKLNNILSKMLSQRRILKVRGKVYIDRFYEDEYLIVFS
ncbi:MAG: hypothetical protein ACTSX9_00635 [Candidatus Njordarchaeales archaeon]